MGGWSLYFLAKLGLYYLGAIDFGWIENLLFAAFLLWPPRWPWLRLARRWLAWPLALWLLYEDSLLPGPARLLDGLAALSGFSGAYLWELAARLVNPWALLGLAAAGAAYVLLARWVPFTLVALLGILSVPVAAQYQAGGAGAAAARGGAPATDPQSRLHAFYQDESRRKLELPQSGATKPDFDIVVLHVCSLAWADLEAAGERNHPLFERFDVLFTRFNSAAAYSGPAVLRLLYGACGQVRHGQLYRGAPRECQIFPVLEQAGFRTAGLLNHDGAFDNFSKLLEYRGGLHGKVQVSRQAPVHMRGFDGSPVHDDYAALSGWWRQQQSQGGQPAALYYNTISLHDGNRLSSGGGRSSLESYKPRLRKLLGDFERFIAQLEASGRPVVLVMLPEHGMALQGGGMGQFSGVREIPEPRITLGPAALKLIGLPKARQPGSPLVVSQPTSYFDVNSLLADLVADSPFKAQGAALQGRLARVGNTPFVAENEGMVVMQDASGGYLMRNEQGRWKPQAF